MRLAALEQIATPQLLPQAGIRAVVKALAEGRCDGAVVPVENSVEGGVTACLDALWEHPELRVERALVLPIRHALLGSGPLEGVSEVLSHPQALAQCSQWLAESLPTALQLPTSSTAEAARMVAGSRFRAAVASLQAAQEHGLEVLAYPINDVAGNCTRFLLLGRGERSLEGPLASLAFSLHANQPGALLEALAARGCNQVLWECGPALAAAALQQGCVQQIAAVIAPKLLGGEAARTPLGDLGLVDVNQAEPWMLQRLQGLGPDLLWQVNAPGPS